MKNVTYDGAIESDIPDLVHLLSLLFSIEKDFNPDFTKQENGLALILKNHETATIQVARNAAGKAVGMVSAQLVISTAQGAASALADDGGARCRGERRDGPSQALEGALAAGFGGVLRRARDDHGRRCKGCVSGCRRVAGAR